MAEKKARAGAAKAAPSKPKPKAFDPKSLSVEEQALVVEEYFGVHPRFMHYEGIAAKVNIYGMQGTNKSFTGWKRHFKQWDDEV